jgi:predicted GTPase
MKKTNVIIIGAAGRDFHNFNTFYRQNENYNVVAFTAAQIPDIADRKYPAELAGPLYPEGIPIYTEDQLENLIIEKKVRYCVFSYSDVSYKHVMSMGSRVNAAGANFLMLGPDSTMVKSTKPVISVCATRTGVGKSQTSRRIIEILLEKGLKVVAIRHPMPYGDLVKQKVQRFANIADLKKHECTIEEMEEYEPHVVRGNVIYAGVDYEAILRAAENDPDGCDVIVWDGGNNDFSFYKSDLYITLADPLRVGDGLSYYPGEVNLRKADVVIINKIDSACLEDIQSLEASIRKINPFAKMIEAASPVTVDQEHVILNKNVLVVEDGPTLTHGGMKLGAGTVAAMKYGANSLVDPRPFVKGKIAETFKIYPEIGKLLPAMGYSKEQLADLEACINETECDAVIIGTPIDLSRVIHIDKEYTRVYYNLQEIGHPNLDEILSEFIESHNLAGYSLV